MAAYSKASVDRPAGMPGAGLHPKNALILIDADDIETFPVREEDGVNYPSSGGDISMATGKKAIAIYFTPGTCQVESNSEGDADAEGFRPSIQLNHPGNSEAVRKFKANWIGKNIIALMTYCDSTVVDIFGTPCNPMRLQANYSGSRESNSNQLTFQQVDKGLDIGIYKGTIPALDSDT